MRDEPDQITNDLTAALVEAGRETFVRAREQHPDESFYCFAFYTNDVATYIEATLLGENGLGQAVESYSSESGTLDERRKSLRWSPCDSPYHTFGEGYFGAVHKILLARPDPYDLDDEKGANREIAFRFDAAFRALKVLDEEGLFGGGSERRKILLNVLQGDQSDKSRLKNGIRLNPPTTWERLRNEFPVSTPTQGHRALGSFKAQHMAAVVCSSNGNLLAACGVEGELFAWDLESMKEILSGNTKGSHWSLAVSADGRLLVVGDKRKVFGITLPAGKRNNLVIDHADRVCGLGISGSGDLVVSSCWDGSLKATDVDSGTKLWEVSLLAKGICFSADDEKLLVAGAGVSLLDPRTGRIEEEIEPDAQGFYRVAWSARGKIAVGHSLPGDKNPPPVYLSNPEGSAERTVLPTVVIADGIPSVGALAFSPDGALLACADDARIHVWSVSEAQHLGWLDAPQGRVDSVVFVSNRSVAACGYDWDGCLPVYLWNLDDVQLNTSSDV